MKSIYVITLFIFFQYSFSQKNTSELNGIEDDIKLWIEKYQAVGLSVAVVKDNEIIYSKGFGYRNLKEQLPVTENTVFPIGSTTKAFTGSLLGILASQNKVSLKDKPAKYIPDFEFYNDKMNNLIAIEDLLSHKSGIGNQGTSEVFFPDKNKLKVVQRLKYLKPEGEIKNSFEYSNMGYTLAGTIVEQITKKSWDTNIQEMIFKPLSMNNSYTELEEINKSDNYSLPYGLYNKNIEQVKFEIYNSISPAGAIKSTVSDLSNWMLTWLNNGTFENNEVIPKAYVKQATRLQNIKNGDYESDSFLHGDGFGWRLKSSYGHYRIDHGGNTFGFSSSLVMFPFEKIGIVVLSNQDNSLLPHLIADIITRKLFNIDPESAYPVKIKEIFKPLPYQSFNKEKMPTHPLDNFCGIFEAKGYGRIKVIIENEKLYAVLPKYKFHLQHTNHNSFFFKPTKNFKDVFSPQFDLKFINDLNGDISGLQLFSQKEPITFKKH
ncbi:serine hydrolase [Aquimarina latercula]|uniref:serine hydrolase n=1 Tax=Aquimarina latercula TaxID=987 RepID=UPI0003F79225|nr:serine hydrolase [Aquimarina latercula]